MSKHNVGSIQDKLCQSSAIKKDAAEISLSHTIFDWGGNSAKKGERLESGKAKGKKEGAI